jgi:hypothetical protein
LKLVTTSVVRGSRPGESHGRACVIDLGAQAVDLAVEANRTLPERPDRDRLAGLRGIALDGDTVYLATSDELLAYSPEFRRVGAWRNAYLADCQGLAMWERRLFLASAGCDAILGFDLDRREFSWAMQVVTQNFRFQPRPFDPRNEDGPLLLDKLHLTDVHCTRGGMYVTGLKTGGMLLFNGHELRMAVELPAGSCDARPFRDGVLFNEYEAGLLRYAGRGGAEDRAFAVPAYPAESLYGADQERGGIARPGLASGLAVLSDALVAGGSSPSTISVYDLPRNTRTLSVNLTMDVRSTIHSIALWPF